MEQEFLKYEESGAYHWIQTSNSMKYYNASLAGRYLKALEIADGLTPMKILDIGCGDGRLTALFAQRFTDAKVVGIDTNKIAIDLAIKKTHGINNISFTHTAISDDIHKLAPDLIVCADVIEHIQDQQSFVAMCYNLLPDGGYFILTTPVRIHEFPKDRFHTHEFFPEELINILTLNGFSVLNHQLSHPLSVGERYSRIYSPFGVGRMKLNKYIINFFSKIFNSNPFIKFKDGLYTVLEMQSILAMK